ncbi:hypothetical protein [Rhizobium rhizogenes]|uniref:hypothetical protein n=1 Tax=Rhizobium rhizogenes TaxID=359 RepID=UPI001571ECE1|nr:hypothetical protein [Rhizobium rhizogenes]NTF69349.1 hypothetical protein [Rhizobium rhizogenes]
MSIDEFMKIGDDASVQIAARPSYLHDGRRLEPRLWEALRIEMQHRLRRATGEPHAIVTFTMNPETVMGVDT